MEDPDDLVGTRETPKPAAPAHKPTPRTHALVRQMARVGIPPKYIAAELGISLKTLTNRYATTIERARPAAINKVLNGIYRRAIAGNDRDIARFFHALSLHKGGDHDYALDWNAPDPSAKSSNDPTIIAPLQIDAVGAISALLSGLKRGEEPVTLEHKDWDDVHVDE